MSVLSTQEIFHSPEEYLAAERLSENKHEYLNGIIYAMAGASRSHNIIAANILMHLGLQLRNSPCSALGSDMRLRIRRSDSLFYYYPDVTVDCSGSRADEVEQPTIIFEILSPQSDRADQGDKLVNYLNLPSMRVYAIVDQFRESITIYRRGEKESWKRDFIGDRAGTLELPEIGCRLTVAQIYERVFDAYSEKVDLLNP